MYTVPDLLKIYGSHYVVWYIPSQGERTKVNVAVSYFFTDHFDNKRPVPDARTEADRCCLERLGE